MQNARRMFFHANEIEKKKNGIYTLIQFWLQKKFVIRVQQIK